MEKLKHDLVMVIIHKDIIKKNNTLQYMLDNELRKYKDWYYTYEIVRSMPKAAWKRYEKRTLTKRDKKLYGSIIGLDDTITGSDDLIFQEYLKYIDFDKNKYKNKITIKLLSYYCAGGGFDYFGDYEIDNYLKEEN